MKTRTLSVSRCAGTLLGAAPPLAAD